ncbi:unnamed protein product, partial [Prorocentrum cordatum]
HALRAPRGRRRVLAAAPPRRRQTDRACGRVLRGPVGARRGAAVGRTARRAGAGQPRDVDQPERVAIAVPGGPGDPRGRASSWPPPSAPAESLAQLLEQVQAKAVSQPYAYMGSSALLGTALDAAQAGRLASAAASAVLDEQVAPGSGPSAFLRDFLTFPQELARLLPPAAVRFRLRSWLRDGCESVEGDLRTRASRKGTLPPTALICSQDDLLVPSRAEGERLLPLLLPRCDGRAELVRLPGVGHAALLDTRIDLAKLIRKSVVGAGPKKPVDYVGSYEPPTLKKVEEGSESVESLASIVSPVFVSADAHGTRSFGLDGVPDPRELGRPVLLVGNHQLFALDLGPLVREFLVEKGFTPRGLAHPSQFPELFPEAEEPPAAPAPSALDAAGLPFEVRAAARASLAAVRGLAGPEEGGGKGKGKGRGKGQGKGQGRDGAGADEGDGGRLFNGTMSLRNWGAVPVTPRNFVRLLQQGEAVLLFPGGAAEALAAPRDKYPAALAREDRLRARRREVQRGGGALRRGGLRGQPPGRAEQLGAAGARALAARREGGRGGGEGEGAAVAETEPRRSRVFQAGDAASRSAPADEVFHAGVRWTG